jgi:hypothetical protein
MNAMEYRSETIPASGEIALSGANFFFLVTSSAAVTVRFMGGGTDFGANSILAGVQIGRVVEWDRAVIRGAAATTVQFFYGNSELREDVTDFRSSIATIAGVPTFTIQQLATMVASPARLTVATANKQTIAANAARRTIYISNPSDNATPGLVYIQTAAAGAGRGIPLDSGMNWSDSYTGALDVRNDSGGSVDVTVQEFQ